MSRQHPLILQLTASGQPARWITFETAAYYIAKELVAWTPSDEGFKIYGGKSRMTGETSSMDLSTIMAVKGEGSNKSLYRTPTLTNRALFRRDQNICAYCGNHFSDDKLTRDHIHPRGRNGKDVWENVVTSCGGCNKYKDCRTPEEAGMKLLYVPYAPCRSEYLLLMNKTVLFDQMEFLKSLIPAHSRIHNPLPEGGFVTSARKKK